MLRNLRRVTRRFPKNAFFAFSGTSVPPFFNLSLSIVFFGKHFEMKEYSRLNVYKVECTNVMFIKHKYIFAFF